MKLCLMILSVPWYMFNGLEHTAILSHFLTSITGSSSRLLCIRFSAANRQTSGESGSLPQYLGCNTVFDMRLRVTFLRRKTVSLQSNIAHRE
jgi:hypothetical protein